jgi:phosphonate transport system substrate-binding protein
MIPRPLRFATFLAPNLYPVYEFITGYVGARLGWPTSLFVGSAYEEMAGGAEIGFLCGLAYVEMSRWARPPVEPLAAPVLHGERYGGRPVYFSDVIVRRDSPWRTFADLRGRSWAYNEPHSHSGYGLPRYHLVRLGETNGYFGRVVDAGWHECAIRFVADGVVDASAIDSHVLAVAVRDDPGLARLLRVLATLGPSTIQPVVAARGLPAPVKAAVRAALLALAEDGAAREWLGRSLIERFVAVGDTDYDDIRAMLAACEAASYFTLH